SDTLRTAAQVSSAWFPRLRTGCRYEREVFASVLCLRDLSINPGKIPRESCPVETLAGGHPTGLSNPGAQVRGGSQIRDPTTPARRIARFAGKSVHTIPNDFRCSSGIADDDRFAACHGFQNHHSERLRFRAGMHDNVKRAYGFSGIVDESG